jgi:hypothetical protein
MQGGIQYTICFLCVYEQKIRSQENWEQQTSLGMMTILTTMSRKISNQIQQCEKSSDVYQWLQICSPLDKAKALSEMLVVRLLIIHRVRVLNLNDLSNGGVPLRKSLQGCC